MSKFVSVRSGKYDWLAYENGDKRIMLHRMARVGTCAARRGERLSGE